MKRFSAHTPLEESANKAPKKLSAERLRGFMQRSEVRLEEIYQISVYKKQEGVPDGKLGRHVRSLWNQYQNDLRVIFEVTKHPISTHLERYFRESQYFLYDDMCTFAVEVGGHSFFLPGSEESTDLNERTGIYDTPVRLNHYGMLACQSLGAIRDQKNNFLEREKVPVSNPDSELKTDLPTVEAVQREAPKKVEKIVQAPEEKIAVASNRVSRELKERQKILLADLEQAVEDQDKSECISILRKIREEIATVAKWFDPDAFENLLKTRYQETMESERKKGNIRARENFLRDRQLDHAFWSLEVPFFKKNVSGDRQASIRKGLAQGHAILTYKAALEKMQKETGVFFSEQGIEELAQVEGEVFFITVKAIAQHF